MVFIDTCSNIDALPMHIGSQAFPQDKKWLEYSGTRKQESFDSNDSKKNSVSGMRSCPRQFLRPQNTPGARSFMRRHPNLFGIGNTSRVLSEMPESEAGTV
jgi:hypothetical protein